jgi:hypothetical protein
MYEYLNPICRYGEFCHLADTLPDLILDFCWCCAWGGGGGGWVRAPAHHANSKQAHPTFLEKELRYSKTKE